MLIRWLKRIPRVGLQTAGGEFTPGVEIAWLDPDVRGYVASGVAHLVGADGAGGFSAEVHVEVLVDLHPAVLGVAVDLEQVRAFLGELGVELVVPAAIERVGHIEPLAVERELEHLRAAIQFVPRGLLALAEQATAPDLAGEARV